MAWCDLRDGADGRTLPDFEVIPQWTVRVRPNAIFQLWTFELESPSGGNKIFSGHWYETREDAVKEALKSAAYWSGSSAGVNGSAWDDKPKTH